MGSIFGLWLRSESKTVLTLLRCLINPMSDLWEYFSAYGIAFLPMGLLLGLKDLILAYSLDEIPRQF
ncbi:hypothetical protein M0802_014886 [Mischocyttarus mexicanus]|nr:hypothetical protein M0802_014886 [Mischocyttarus mexicanus]